MRRPQSIAEYAQVIESGEPFAQVNYADGEWMAVIGETDQPSGKTCDGQSFSERATKLMRQTITEPRDYVYATVFRDGWYRRARRTLPFVNDVDWHDKNIIFSAHRKGETGPLIRALRTRRVLLVGPAHLQQLPFGWDQIVVPDHDALDHVDRLTLEVADAIHPESMVCFSASFAAKVLIWRLWPECEPWRVSMLDTGSLFDGLVGRYSRSSTRKPDWPAKAEHILTEAMT
jgi:hypothetical protein